VSDSFVSEVIVSPLVVNASARAHAFARRKRNALPMTDTELKLIAAAAIIGDKSSPKHG
jgi:hypothetical protein